MTYGVFNLIIFSVSKINKSTILEPDGTRTVTLCYDEHNQERVRRLFLYGL